MRFQKGNKLGKCHKGRGPGRPPGMLDRAQLIRMALEAIDRVGGVTYLAKLAKDEPSVFMSFVGRAMPQKVESDVTVVSLTDCLRRLADSPDVAGVLDVHEPDKAEPQAGNE